jgi:hypothetical protein
MRDVDPSLVEKFATVIEFLSTEPAAASLLRGRLKLAVGSEPYIRFQASAFAAGRAPRSPQPPTTIPDSAVSLILHHYFGMAEADLVRAKEEHLLSMAAENLVGDVLERYLAKVMEPRGWVWCSGSTVRAADFLRRPKSKTQLWRALQVKNRDNSENSSSSAIREGTIVEKWFRTFSRRPGSNWASFPEVSLRGLLSEEGFHDFITNYLLSLRTNKTPAVRSSISRRGDV